MNDAEELKKTRQRFKEAETRAKEAETRVKELEKEAETIRKEAETRVKEAETRVKEAETRREAAERQLAPSNYNTYLDFCHWDIFLKPAIETNARLASTGLVANPNGKYYPLHFKPWVEFPDLHARCQSSLQTLFDDKPLFWSPGHVGVVTKLVQGRMMTDEQDMRLFQFLAVESCVREVLLTFLQETKAADEEKQKQQHHDQREEEREQEEAGSKDTHSLPTTVLFESVSYGLSVYDIDDPDLDDPRRPAYKPALVLAREQDMASRGRGRGETDDGPPLKRVASPTRKHFPDQWLIRVEADEKIQPIFIVEYKAAHKLRASMVKRALRDEENGGLFAVALHNKLSSTVPQEGDDKTLAEAQNGTAAVVSQAFHYMIEFGLSYCYVTSGEMILLLHLRPEEPETLYYHLCVPADEVTEQKRGQAGSSRRSAVSVVSTLALLALDGPLLSQRWKQEAESRLQRWPTAYPEMEAHLPHDSGSEEGDERAAVLSLLPPSTGTQGCRDPSKPERRPRKDDEDGDFRPAGWRGAMGGKPYATRLAARSAGSQTQGSGSGSRGDTSHKRAAAPYCTQACLLGLRKGGKLDGRCPNVEQHRRHCGEDGRHGLSAEQLIEQLQKQLAEDLDNNCDPLDRYRKCGAIGTLFRLTLQDGGYCVVAKGVEQENAGRLRAETHIYDYLQAWQGDLVPVCLGTVQLVHDYISMRGIHVTHMLVLSYGGEPALAVQGRDKAVPPTETLQQLARESWTQLAATGVVHGDEREPNVVWNEERQRMMCIDFDRAWIARPKTKKGRGTAEAGETEKRLWKKQRVGKSGMVTES